MASKVIKVKYKKDKGVFEPLEPVESAGDFVGEVTIPEPEAETDDAAFLASAGGWRDFDAEAFIKETYERRRSGNRPPVEL